MAACSRTARYDLVLAGGRVMDPATRLDAIRNIGISGEKIVAISEAPLTGATVVNVPGHVVAPGFIDLHAHGQTTSDMEIQARDGVTTALEMEAGVYPVAAWYQSMQGKAPLNYGATVSHIAARFAVFHPGLEIGHWATNRARIAGLGLTPAGANQAAGASETKALAEAIRRGLDDGALGVGFGINYTPAAEPAEIEAMFRVAGARKVPVFVHTRAFGIDAIREAITTAKTAGAALHIVHVGSSGIGDLPEVLTLIDSSKAAGMDITTEVYPYTAASTFINGTGHPRGAGTFARVLGHYSREKKILPLMDALAKMTILPAQRLEGHVPAMKSKGRIAAGADADVTVFDPATVIDRATFDAPTTPSAGIPHVLVNGTFVVRDGQTVKGATPGRPVRVESQGGRAAIAAP